ncbi:MAG: hypothetical protein Q8O88_04280 [bacterium]|nr:hypothetical protein [bacterium]
MDELKNIRSIISKTISEEYSNKKWLIYKTTVSGIKPQHNVIDGANTEEEARTKVDALEVKDPSGIYYYDKKIPVAIHSFQLNELSEILSEAGRIDFLTAKFREWANTLYSQGHFVPKEGIQIPNDLINTFKKLPPKPKYDKEMSKIFKQLIDSDPLPNKQNSQWIIRLFTNNLLKLEDLNKVTNYLTLYEKVKQRVPIEQRDINKIKSLPELYDVISKFEQVELKSKAQVAKEEKLEGADRILDNEHWLILTPKTEAAACLYGQETQWCTASKGNNYFQRYNKEGPLYIIFDKSIKETPRKNPNKKLQFHFESSQFMDARDASINIGDFFRKHKDLLALFDELGRTSAKFKLEHRLMPKEEVMQHLTNPKERVKFLEGDSDKFGAEWMFNYLLELGETEEIRKIIFEDPLFLNKLLVKGQLNELEYGLGTMYGYKLLDDGKGHNIKDRDYVYNKVPDGKRKILADFLYNNPIILSFFSKNPIKNDIIEMYTKMLFNAGSYGKKYAQDMYIKTDTMYNVFRKNKDLIGFYDMLQSNIGPEGVVAGLKMVSDNKSKYVKDILTLYTRSEVTLNNIRAWLKDALKDNIPSKSMKESFSIEVFQKQFMKEGNDYLKNIGFLS